MLRFSTLLTALSVLALGTFATSCGGATNVAANPMALVEFLIVDQALQPAAPTGSSNVPRNARFSMEFSELVNPNTVNFQTVQVRTGPSFQSIPGGSFRTSANRVIYDPTIETDGTPRPFGLAPVAQHSIDIPNFEEQDGVIENLDFDPNISTFFTTFTTSDGFLRELVPPEFVRHFWIPPEDDLTSNIPGNGILALEFSEAMDPSTFVLGPTVGGPDVGTTVDIRYTNDAINQVNLVALEAIPGTFSFDPSATIYFFKPTFSFGDEKLIFTAQVFQNLTDLAGNLLINPQSMGPFTCDGDGISKGKVISETFDFATDRDQVNSDADWGSTEQGFLKGQPITSRDALIMGWVFANSNGTDSSTGQYAPIDSPLNGLDRNNFNPAPNPATALGRRVMWSFPDTEIGAAGSVTAIGWGPDSNATFAATYEGIVLNLGNQASASTGLAASFSGNFAGAPTVVYMGNYNVTQAANIGNTPGINPVHTGPYGTNPGCNPQNGVGVLFNWNVPLFTATGFFMWPELTNFYEWDPGDINIDDDSVLVFDANVPEGDSFQQIRGWFGVTFPCSGVLLASFPRRRMYAGFEEDQPNPPDNPGAGVANPEPSITDTMFTITRRLSTAQSIFYADPNFLAMNPTYPPPTGGTTFGVLSNYLTPELNPSLQTGGADIIVEFQGAFGVQDDRITINQAQPFTDWTQDIDDCDGFPFIRWRATLISNLISGAVPRLGEIRIPVTDDN